MPVPIWKAHRRGALLCILTSLATPAQAAGSPSPPALGPDQIADGSIELKKRLSEPSRRSGQDRLLAQSTPFFDDLFGKKPGGADPKTLYSRYQSALKEKRIEDRHRLAQEAFFARHVLVPDDPFRKKLLGTVWLELLDMGWFNEAEQHIREELEFFRKKLGESHEFTLSTHQFLAFHLVTQKRYVEARMILQSLLPTARRTLGQQNDLTLKISILLAQIHRREGDYEAVEPLYRMLASGYSAQLGPHDAKAIKYVLLHTEALVQLDRFDEAERLLREALIRCTAKHGGEHRQTLNVVEGIGTVLDATGRSEEAEGLFRELLAKRRATLGEKHGDTVRAYRRLGELLHKRGSLPKAVPLLRTALGGARKFGVKEEATRAASSLAAILLHEGQSEEAVGLLEEIGERILEQQLDAIAETNSSASVEDSAIDPDKFESLVYSGALKARNAKAIELALETALTFKQPRRAADEALTASLGSSESKMVRSAAQNLAKRRAALASALARGGSDVSAERRALDRAREQAAKALGIYGLDRFGRDEFALPGEFERRTGLDKLKGALPPGDALLEFRIYRPFNWTRLDLDDQRVLGFLVRSATEPSIVDLGSYAEIQAEIARATALKTDSVSRRSAASKLSERLLAPFAGEIARAKTVYLSPDGALNLLPFDYLPFASSQYWIETSDVRMISAGRVLVRTRSSSKTKGLLALGGVDFNKAGTAVAATSAARPAARTRHLAAAMTRSSDLDVFGPLSETLPEVEDVAALFKVHTGEPTRLLSGVAAHESELKRARPPRVLHIASHGFFFPDENRAAVDPMTLSGIALAGANRGLKGESDPDDEDGVLWALEAMGLPLQGTQLVTLSACDTAKGVVDAGEGVYGLGRAFQIAGADNVLLTLWALDDFGARAFMGDFYKAWLSGEEDDPAVALRATKLAWARSRDPQRADPQFWAPYVLIQNGR